MAVQFGIVNAGTSYGFATSVERDQQVETETYADADGDTKGYKNYDKRENLTISATYDSDNLPPAMDTTITLTMDSVSRKYTVTGVKTTEENAAYRKVEITAMRWITNTIPA